MDEKADSCFCSSLHKELILLTGDKNYFLEPLAQADHHLPETVLSFIFFFK